MNNRRDFLKTVILTVGVMTAWPARFLRAKKLAISMDKVDKLKSVGGYTILKIKGINIMFIRDSEETVRALNPICTHKQCQVNYNAEKKTLDCPCHGSRYDLTGQVLAGPAEKPLTAYPAYMDDKGRIIISIGEEE